MEQAIIEQTIKALERKHFEVYFANDRQEARDIFFQEIFDKIKPRESFPRSSNDRNAFSSGLFKTVTAGPRKHTGAAKPSSPIYSSRVLMPSPAKGNLSTWTW